ncbi:MAG: arylsulfotransferase family protein [Gemmataceae bacterium]|nr:arylsulfotransferase family protein [Gemmataceae bacterium]
MPPISRRRILAWIATLGAMSLCYLVGAATMFFALPPCGFLDKAFTGAQAWYDQRNELAKAPGAAARRAVVGEIDHRAKTFDGFTLYTTYPGAQAVLINMRGDVVHKWSAPFSRIWPRAPHVRRPVGDPNVHFFGCHLYANGDLLAVMHGYPDTPYGYGLVKLDKDSKVLWRYAQNAHHTVDVGDDGTIYALTHEVVREMPHRLKFLPTPGLVDSVVLLSPEGEELKKVPVLEAFRDSPFAALLPVQPRVENTAWDVHHTNSVEVLSRQLASRFPMFQAGHVLISVRELGVLAMLDPDGGTVTWAARGPWRLQHGPHFLTNGRLLIFDNLGHPEHSRVLEYDPRTQAIPWSYPRDGDPALVSDQCGESQRLPNGNTLIVHSTVGELHEVTPDRELVWSAACGAGVPWARRYAADQLPFLRGEQHARP